MSTFGENVEIGPREGFPQTLTRTNDAFEAFQASGTFVQLWIMYVRRRRRGRWTRTDRSGSRAEASAAQRETFPDGCTSVSRCSPGWRNADA